SHGTALAFTIRLAWWSTVAMRVACDDVPPRQIVMALLSSLVLQAAIGIVQFAVQHHLGLSVLGELPVDLAYPGVSVISTGGPPLIRLYGLSGHPNVIGGFAAVALLLGVGLLRERRGPWWAMWLIGLTALLLTFSRSAALGLLSGAIVIALLRRPNRRRALMLITSGGSVIGIFVLLFAPFLIARVSGEVATEQVSIDERIEQTALAWQLISDRPLTGVGVGNFTQYNAPNATTRVMRVHNVPLLIASELGWPGLWLWLISVGAVIVAGVRSARATTAIWPALLTSAVIAILVISLFDYYWWTSSQGVYVWATMCGALLAQAVTRSTRNGVPSTGSVSNSRAAR
ncbi:MAG: O-antigen ligase family protein, partial [Chloroflexi bacterium]|nr:O-antigen ligase family protein [Chloroflexota bacterium]